MFDISELFIQYNADSCCEHIAGGVNIYLHGRVSLLPFVGAGCLGKSEY